MTTTDHQPQMPSLPFTLALCADVVADEYGHDVRIGADEPAPLCEVIGAVEAAAPLLGWRWHDVMERGWHAHSAAAMHEHMDAGDVAALYIRQAALFIATAYADNAAELRLWQQEGKITERQWWALSAQNKYARQAALDDLCKRFGVVGSNAR
jgi:hypothetical protein